VTNSTVSVHQLVLRADDFKHLFGSKCSAAPAACLHLATKEAHSNLVAFTSTLPEKATQTRRSKHHKLCSGLSPYHLPQLFSDRSGLRFRDEPSDLVASRATLQ
jgi:hypothetical protein